MSVAGWAVATPHETASGLAAEVLGRGGNAVDAALAAAVALTVVYPNQCSVGGDVIALVGLPDGSAHAVDGTGRSPRALSPERLAGATSMPVDGGLAVTVPGAPAAWQLLADRWGTRPLADALRPAAALAADGVPVAPGLARDLDRERVRLGADAGMRGVYFRDGDVLAAGATLTQPRLAHTLTELAGGVDALYLGDVGAHLVRTLREYGSPMTASDLADHRTVVGEPLTANHAGEEYVTAPPASQGAFFLEGLAALELLGRRLDLDGADAGLVAAVLAAAAQDRDELLGDPDHTTLDVDHLLTERAAELAHAATRGAGPPAPRASVTASGDTVAVVAADATGTWVSLIQSVFHAFGSGILDPATGVVLHNRGASFSLDPRSPNRLTGGRRPAHTLMPVLVRRDGRVVGAHGTMGGRAQPQIHTQVALRLAHGAGVAEAVAAPRWILGAMEMGGAEGPPAVNVETDVPQPARDALASAFTVVPLPPRDDGAGHVQVVRSTQAGLVAATDPRADGAALVDG